MTLTADGRRQQVGNQVPPSLRGEGAEITLHGKSRGSIRAYLTKTGPRPGGFGARRPTTGIWRPGAI